MTVNEWSKKEVERAESRWGSTLPQYSKDMFNYVTAPTISSYLDLGCGFGRFLEFLLSKFPDPDYIGYDSSPAMIERIHKRFPDYSSRIFLKNVTAPITHRQESILISAVFIHLEVTDQVKILNNILEIKPKRIAFDINSPQETYISQKGDRTAFIKGSEHSFRMTWQSHYKMTRLIIEKFVNYNLMIKFYDLKNGQHKVVYFLESIISQGKIA